MDLAAAWVAFPLLLTLLGTGLGAIAERLSARALGVLRLPVGFALMVVVLTLTTRDAAIAPAGVPLVTGLALAGLAALAHASRSRRRHPSPQAPRHPRTPAPRDTWAVFAALAVFAAFAAPIVLSGHPTLSGYIKLDDTATWLAFADHIPDHGRSVAGLHPSTHSATLSSYLPSGYPVGSFLPLTFGPDLLARDSAWLVAPYMAFLAAIGSLALYGLAGSVLAPGPFRAVAAATAGQASLLYGYAGWGGVKEVAAAALAATFVAAAAPVTARRARSVVPALIAVAALVLALSLGGLIWAIPSAAILALPALVRSARGLRKARPNLGPRTLGAGALAAGALLLAARADPLAGSFDSITNLDTANLGHHLSGWQLFGIWPAGDFRADPHSPRVVLALIVFAAVGVAVALQRARKAPLALSAYVIGAPAAAGLIAAFASPWLAGKGLATASPALLLGALSGAGVIHARHAKVEGMLIAGLLAGGVLWSNALAFHHDNLAPYDRLHELERIGHEIAGQGPTLMTDYEPYGARHFLRAADAEGASELRVRRIPLRDGSLLGKTLSADVDAFSLRDLLGYRTLVLRTSPTASRPPLPYALLRHHRYYDVWQRPAERAGSVTSPAVLGDLPLGGPLDAGAVPDCAAVAALARTPSAATLAAPPRTVPLIIPIDTARHPASWGPAPTTLGGLTLTRPATMDVTLTVAPGGRYSFWIGGAIPGRLSVSLDGLHVGFAHGELAYPGGYVRVGERTVAAGTHRVTLRYEVGDLDPGSAGIPATAGPLILSSETFPPPLLRVPVRDYRALCSKRLDWVEALSA